MSAGKAWHSPENESSGAMNLDETELTLGLPGRESRCKSGTKRGFSVGRSIDGRGKAAKNSGAAASGRAGNEAHGGATSKLTAAK